VGVASPLGRCRAAVARASIAGWGPRAWAARSSLAGRTWVEGSSRVARSSAERGPRALVARSSWLGRCRARVVPTSFAGRSVAVWVGRPSFVGWGLRVSVARSRSVGRRWAWVVPSSLAGRVVVWVGRSSSLGRYRAWVLRFRLPRRHRARDLRSRLAGVRVPLVARRRLVFGVLGRVCWSLGPQLIVYGQDIVSDRWLEWVAVR
jgi:hypothetical protein